MKKSSTTHFTLDPQNPPPLTTEQQAMLETLAAKPDDAIDYSDIPPIDQYRPRKKATTLRLDADVLAWLQEQGRGYQTRINAILRHAMLDDRNQRHG